MPALGHLLWGEPGGWEPVGPPPGDARRASKWPAAEGRARLSARTIAGAFPRVCGDATVLKRIRGAQVGRHWWFELREQRRCNRTKQILPQIFDFEPAYAHTVVDSTDGFNPISRFA